MNTFEITVQRKLEKTYPVVVLQTQTGSFLPIRTEGSLELDRFSLEEAFDPKAYGVILGKALFTNSLRDAFTRAMTFTRDSEDKSLRVLLFIEAEDLKGMHWERLCAPFEGNWDFLSLHQQTPFSLYLPSQTDRRFPPIGSRDLRALVLVASPKDLSSNLKLADFDVPATVASIRTALGSITCDVLANNVIDALGPPTLNLLIERLSLERYTLLHIVCHGAVNQAGETILFMPRDESGQSVLGSLLIERLQRIGENRSLPQFTFLCTCESAPPQAEYGFGGLAQRLVRELGMPAVLAMTDKISIPSAQALEKEYYARLLDHGEVDLALSEALVALQGRFDVTVPALMSRLGGRPLFSDRSTRPLTDQEILSGLELAAKEIQLRAPILKKEFDETARRIQRALGSDHPQVKAEREADLQAIRHWCLDLITLSFENLALGKAAPKYDVRCPFKGMSPFSEADREFFFGREAEVTKLEGLLADHPFVAVLGASGSGKSSLVMAGLLPRLNGKQVVLTPSNEPLARLETALKSEHEWLVVDQFEELFTHCKNEAERKAFIEQLLALPRVILTMRADFLGECAVYPALRQAIEQHQCLVGPLAPEQLRTAMEKQAAQVGLHFEGGLTQRLMDDVTGEPGAMPLLQHALKLLWDHRQGPWLRAEEYEAMGGVRNAVANTADQFYGGLEEADQERVRDIFMRLTHLSDALAGEDPRDTRQRVRLADLVPAGAETAPVQELVAQLDEQHLVVVNEGEVEVVHEALIRHWPRLRKWIEENRAGLKLRESVRENALEWESHQRDESFLDHRGSRLEEALTLSEQPRFALNILEKAYLDACVNAVRREQVRREQLRFRITAGLVVGLVIMSAIAVFASLQWQRAELQRQESLARQLAANAQMLKADRPELSLLLGAQAFKINDNFETRSSLLSAAQCCSDALVTFLNGHTDSVWDVAFSPDGKWLASSGNDGSIIIWEVATHQPITRLTNPASTATIYTVAFSPSEKILAAGDSTGLITLYDTQSWQRLRQPLHGHTSMVLAAKFSKDGSLLVSGGADGQVLVWKMANRTLAHTFTGHTDWVWDIAISVDNQTVASVSRDKTLRLWNLEPGSSVPNLSVPASPSVSAAFYDDPEHPLLLTGDRTGSVVIWDLRPWQQKHEAPLPAPGLKVVAGATTEVWGLAFIPGQELSFVTGRSRGIINRNRIVPDAKYSAFKLQPEILGVTAHSIGLFRIDVSPDGKLIAAAGQDGLVSLWASQLAPNVYWHAAEVNNLQILDGEKNLLSIDKNGMVSRWETRSQNLVSQVRFNTRQVLRSAFSRDGSLAVTGNDQGAISLWEVQTGKRLQFLNQHQAAITSLAFSPHGDRFASSDNQGKVILWQIGANGKATPSEPFTDVHQSAIRVLLFSPDGNRLIGGGCGYPITFPKPDCSQGAIFVWDTQPALKLSYTFPGKAGFVWSMALNPANSDEVATGTPDGTITIWSLRTRSQHLSFRLATEVIPALAFSPDGSLLAVSAEGYKVLLYSTQTGQPYGQFFKEHDLAVNSLAFTANGERLFSASVDNTIVAHDLQPANWLVRTCRMINRNLTWAEWQQYLGEALPYQAVCPNLPLEPEPTNTPIP